MRQIQDFSIRYFKETDFPHIVRMVGEIFKTIYPEDKVPVDKIKDLFDKALINTNHTGIVLVDLNDTPKGYIFASINELFFHKKSIAMCLSIWVDEDCRGHSLDMLRAFEKWAKYKGVNHMLISEFKDLTPKKTDVIFKKLGFYLKEKQYWKDL